MKIRLQKAIAEAGIASRRKAELLIKEGKVFVNGKVQRTLGSSVDPDCDEIRIGKKFIRPAKKGVIVFHKPRGVVSTLSDPQGRRTITDFLTAPYRSYFPIGRLDWNTTGLLILTNDGELAERLSHPRYGVVRTYHVRVEGAVAERVLAKLNAGLRLSDGLVRPEVRYVSGDDKSSWLEVRVREGRNQLVRRLMERVEHPVIKLQRVAFGPFKLGRIRPGEIRKLTEAEYKKFRSQVLRSAEAKSAVRDRS